MTTNANEQRKPTLTERWDALDAALGVKGGVALTLAGVPLMLLSYIAFRLQLLPGAEAALIITAMLGAYAAIFGGKILSARSLRFTVVYIASSVAVIVYLIADGQLWFR